MAAALGLTAIAPGAAQTAAHLRVVTTPSDSGAEAYYALELGFFRKAGLDVEVTALSSGQAVAPAIAAGAADVGQGNLIALATAHEHGVDFTLIAPASLYSSDAVTSALVVAKDSPIRSAADLVGKTIAAPAVRDLGQVTLDAWLVQQGVAPTSVRTVEMPSAQIAAALSHGTIDAGTLIEPFLSKALATDARILAPTYNAVAKQFLTAGYFTKAGWARAHPEVVKCFARAMLDTARWANADHARSAQILSRYAKVQLDPQQTRVRYAESLSPALIQPLIDAAARDGVLRAPFPAVELLAGAR